VWAKSSLSCPPTPPSSSTSSSHFSFSSSRPTRFQHSFILCHRSRLEKKRKKEKKEGFNSVPLTILISLIFLHPLTSPPSSRVLIKIQNVPGYIYCCNLLIYYLRRFRFLPPKTGAARPRVRLRVSSDAPCRNAQARIFQRHPRQWEARHGDMSEPRLLVVLMKLGVGRVGSRVQVPGFPSNESAGPHSNPLLPWELTLGLPSTVLKYRLISSVIMGLGGLFLKSVI